MSSDLARNSQTLDTIRARFRARGGYAGVGIEGSRDFLRHMRPPGGSAVAHVVNMTVGGNGVGVPVRIYHPRPGDRLPAIVWTHGGGWCVGNTDTTDAVCRELAVRVDSVIVSVDHRRAPEHPFPAPLDDVVAAIAWVLTEGATIGTDATRIAVGGESSGANLTLAALLRLRAAGMAESIAHQILVVPVADLEDRPSLRADADPALTVDDLRWFVRQYVPDPAQHTNPCVFPLHAASLAGLPATTIVTAGLDPLRDSGIALVGRLLADGVIVDYLDRPGVGHGMLADLSQHAPGRDVIQHLGALLRAVFFDNLH